ncbi:MAG: alanine--tRNA ligase [Dehalococcoidia bacterium]|nr:alanine--tRNA ligase [Dehalococcoidia bacterium]
MNSNEIREVFLLFFKEKEHRLIPSSSLIPKSDPTLLLTTAGMVQFKRYFTGEATPPHPRLVSCQKCFRTTDIDCVGDAKHLTFFEMLGNFSVGDYFKREAIQWAWEFVTQRLGLSRQRLWVTIYLDDDEAFDYWREVGLPEDRVIRFGDEENFWGPAGDTGPCGPCSEIHYDHGEGVGCGKPDCGPNCDCSRFSEIWNLVFTQYDQHSDGSRIPLPKPNIDTGMGLERTAAAMQGVTSVYDTDLFTPLIELVGDLTGKRYGNDEATDRAMRVVAEHARAITFLIGDGVLPSNEGRGYVLRRVLRRAALFGRKLGLEEQFLGSLAETVIGTMSRVYPELKQGRKLIVSTVAAEEMRFDQTLTVGLNLLDGFVEETKSKGKDSISGVDIFKLYDTYGFPKELTAEIAAENGLLVDLEGFEAEMERQRGRARAAQKVSLDTLLVYSNPAQAECKFIDNKLDQKTSIEWIESNGRSQFSVVEGQEVQIIIRETPFYGEMGGQVGDTGEIIGPHGRLAVVNSISPTPKVIIHHGKVVEGEISVGDTVKAHVDRERRQDIARNHTATHLLQAALREVLGGHVRQSGSLVDPDHLRFDFAHPSAVTKEELSQIQHIVNEKIRQNLKVTASNMPYQQALDRGALAFFEEQYGEEVRVLEIGKPPISAELCGGTHVKATGEIGFLQIVDESSIGAGLRRIEAVTGRGAEALIDGQLSIIDEVAEDLKASPLEIKSRIAALHSEIDTERKRALALERELSKNAVGSLLGDVVTINGIPLLTARVSASNMEALRQTGDMIKDSLESIVVVLGAVYGDQANFVAMLTPDLVKKGLHAGEIVKQVAQVTGGRGGGRAEMGQGGGKDIKRLDNALSLVRDLVTKHGDPGT